MHTWEQSKDTNYRHPVLELPAVRWQNVVSNTPLIPKYNFKDDAWIHILDVAYAHLSVESITDLDTGEEIDIAYEESFFRNIRSPWIRISADVLSSVAGQHMYEISFLDRYTKDEISLYFSYVIQDDDPDKPYVYMKRQENK